MKTNIPFILILVLIAGSLLLAFFGVSFSLDVFRTQPLILLLLVGAIGLAYQSIIYRKERANLPLVILLLLLLIISYQFILSHLTFELYSKILLFLTYFILSFQYIQKQQEKGVFEIALFIICLIVILSIISLFQYLKVVETDSRFSIVGIFDNPVGVASFLSISLPYLFFVFQKNKMNNTFIKLIFLAIIILSCGITFLSGSRSGIISTVLAVLLSSSFILRKKKILLILCIIPLLLPLYTLKKDSADGRMFIWTNTIRIIENNMWLGAGYDGFTKEYMTYQAKYFHSMEGNNQTKRIAGNIRDPLNEYLGFILTWGVFGVLLMVIFIVYTIYIYKQNKSPFKNYAIISLIALGVFSFFSYPLSYPINLVFLAVNLAIILCPTSRNKDPNIASNIFANIIICLSFMLSLYSIYNENLWKKTETLISDESTNISISEYSELMQKGYFKNNRDFLYDYAMVLYENKEYSKCLLVLEKCENYIKNYNTQMIAGYCYKEIGQPKESKQCFYMAHYMVPHKFVPLHELMEEAYKRNDRETAMAMAKIIIDKPIKIKSYKVNMVKKRANEILTILNKKGGANWKN